MTIKNNAKTRLYASCFCQYPRADTISQSWYNISELIQYLRADTRSQWWYNISELIQYLRADTISQSWYKISVMIQYLRADTRSQSWYKISELIQYFWKHVFATGGRFNWKWDLRLKIICLKLFFKIYLYTYKICSFSTVFRRFFSAGIFLIFTIIMK